MTWLSAGEAARRGVELALAEAVDNLERALVEHERKAFSRDVARARAQVRRLEDMLEAMP